MVLVANILQPLTDVEEWILEHLHALGLGWGLAIVGLTLLIRACTIPLVVKQFRSQRDMKLHMPELKALQAKYKGDRKKLQEETAAYYKHHGINPLASIGPLLLQIPVFISLYMLLRADASSGLFGDSSLLFIPDLTEKPHGAALVAILTIYVGSQLGASAIATRTLASNHRGIAMALPVVFAGIIVRFPAGLAIYSVTTSLWSLGQQIVFWRLSPAVPSGSAAIAAEVEDVAEAGHEEHRDGAANGNGGIPAGVATNGNGDGDGAPAEPAPAGHSRSKKKKRSRSRR